jgi:hypothetical protein
MDIDLLFTREGEGGLICSGNFVQKAIGVLFDSKSGLTSVEFIDGEVMDFNIPVEQDFFEAMDYAGMLHIGAVKGGHISQAYQVPLMFLDDPYRGDAMMASAQSGGNAYRLSAFESFIKRCITGQPVHREDLGDEDTMGCVLGDSSPSALQFAPHLARQRNMEVKPQLDLGHVPGLGLGSSGGGSTQRSQKSTAKKPPKDEG